MSNWLIIIKDRNQLWLQIGSQCCWLHSKSDIHPQLPPQEEGVKEDKVTIMLTDRVAERLLHEWLLNGPFDLSNGEQCSMRFPDELREALSELPGVELSTTL